MTGSVGYASGLESAAGHLVDINIKLTKNIEGARHRFCVETLILGGPDLAQVSISISLRIGGAWGSRQGTRT